LSVHYICYLKEGDNDKMLEHYEKYRLIDPSYGSIYRMMIGVLEKKGDKEAVHKLLKEGIGYFSRRVELYEPRNDPNVSQIYNQKAFLIHKEAQKELRYLKAAEKRLNKSL